MPRNKNKSKQAQPAPAGPTPYKDVVAKAEKVAEESPVTEHTAMENTILETKPEGVVTTSDLPEESQRAAQSLLRRAEVALNLVRIATNLLVFHCSLK